MSSFSSGFYLKCLNKEKYLRERERERVGKEFCQTLFQTYCRLLSSLSREVFLSVDDKNVRTAK